MLQMVALKELDDRRLNTTLVSPQSPLAKNLGSFLTVVMTRQNTVLLSNPNGRQSKLAEESILWKGICFKPFRSEINPTEIERIATPPIDLKASSSSTHPHLRTVDQWVKQSASEALSDPFSPRIVTKELPTPRPQEFIRPADQPTPVRKRHIKSRKPLGQDVPQTKSLVPNAILIDPIDCSAEFTATASLEAKHPVMINSDIGSYDKSSSGISEGSHSGHESLELKESARKEFSAAAIRPPAPNEPYPPPIKAPYMPLEPRTSSQIDDLDLDPVWQRNTVTTRKGGRLIDIPVMKFSVSEKVQSQRETDTRVVKRTMDQRKPAGFAKSSNSFVILLDSFEKATRRILEVARKSQGMPVDMQVQIGRILISPQSAIPEYKKRPFAVTEWPLAFPAANRVKKLETFFANM